MKTKATAFVRNIALGAAFAFVACPVFGEWKPAPSPLMTEWGEKVTPENAWREYPRPQLVRNEWTNLNGMWEYAVTSNAGGTREQPWAKVDPGICVARGEILVPYCIESALSGVGRKLEPSEILWYRRMIDVKKRPGERTLLHFGAVDFRCQVFIGHKEVTDVPHEGGNVPFTVDITDYVEDGSNELIVSVWDPTTTFVNANTGKQVLKEGWIWYTRVSGIWQTVWLENVPETYIRSYEVIADVANGTAAFSFDVAGSSFRKDEVEVSISGGASATTKDGKVVVKMPDGFKTWSPDSPHLYDFTAKCGKDSVKGYFAMRTIEKRADAKGVLRFHLNGQPIFLYAPLDQGWWPEGLLTPPSEEAMKFDIASLKDLGFNAMRKHIKVEPARYYHLCDKLGLIVIQDMPSGNREGDVNQRFTAFRREMKDMIDSLKVFPSIVMWVPYNESWSQPGAFYTHNVLDWVKRYDSTRLVDGPSGWNDWEGGSTGLKRPVSQHRPPEVCEAADTVDFHIYRGPGMPAVNPRRISFLGEFGGLGWAVEGHTWLKEAKNWGYGGMKDTSGKENLTRVYCDLMNRLGDCAAKGLSGAVYTQTTDVESEVNGLWTYDRKVLKVDRDAVRAAHAKVYARSRE